MHIRGKLNVRALVMAVVVLAVSLVPVQARADGSIFSRSLVTDNSIYYTNTGFKKTYASVGEENYFSADSMGSKLAENVWDTNGNGGTIKNLFTLVEIHQEGYSSSQMGMHLPAYGIVTQGVYDMISELYFVYGRMSSKDSVALPLGYNMGLTGNAILKNYYNIVQCVKDYNQGNLTAEKMINDIDGYVGGLSSQQYQQDCEDIKAAMENIMEMAKYYSDELTNGKDDIFENPNIFLCKNNPQYTTKTIPSYTVTYYKDAGPDDNSWGFKGKITFDSVYSGKALDSYKSPIIEYLINEDIIINRAKFVIDQITILNNSVLNPLYADAVVSGIYAEMEEEKEPGSLEESLSSLVRNVASSIQNMFAKNGITMESLIYGRVKMSGGSPTLTNNYSFELQENNMFGIVGAVIYSVLRGLLIMAMIVAGFGSVVRAGVSTSTKTLAESKGNIGFCLASLVVLFAVPGIVDFLLYVRDLLISAIGQEFNTLGNDGLEISLINQYYKTSESGWFIDSLMYLGVVGLVLYFLVAYISTACSFTIAFGFIPLAILLSYKDRDLLKTWAKYILSVAIVPVIDSILILFPLLGRELAEADGIVLVILCMSVIPARKEVRSLFCRGIGMGSELLGIGALIAAGRAVSGFAKATGSVATATADGVSDARSDFRQSKVYEGLADAEESVSEHNLNKYDANEAFRENMNNSQDNPLNYEKKSNGGQGSGQERMDKIIPVRTSGSDAYSGRNGMPVFDEEGSDRVQRQKVLDKYATPRNISSKEFEAASSKVKADMYRRRGKRTLARTAARGLGALGGGAIGGSVGAGAAMFYGPGAMLGAAGAGVSVGTEFGGFVGSTTAGFVENHIDDIPGAVGKIRDRMSSGTPQNNTLDNDKDAVLNNLFDHRDEIYGVDGLTGTGGPVTPEMEKQANDDSVELLESALNNNPDIKSDIDRLVGLSDDEYADVLRDYYDGSFRRDDMEAQNLLNDSSFVRRTADLVMAGHIAGGSREERTRGIIEAVLARNTGGMRNGLRRQKGEEYSATRAGYIYNLRYGTTPKDHPADPKPESPKPKKGAGHHGSHKVPNFEPNPQPPVPNPQPPVPNPPKPELENYVNEMNSESDEKLVEILKKCGEDYGMHLLNKCTIKQKDSEDVGNAKEELLKNQEYNELYKKATSSETPAEERAVKMYDFALMNMRLENKFAQHKLKEEEMKEIASALATKYIRSSVE